MLGSSSVSENSRIEGNLDICNTARSEDPGEFLDGQSIVKDMF